MGAEKSILDWVDEMRCERWLIRSSRGCGALNGTGDEVDHVKGGFPR
jgi:hypothetical protein